MILPFTILVIEGPTSNFVDSSTSDSQDAKNPFYFPKNLLLSTNDLWKHHVEPTMALGDEDRIYVGWKNADEHDGGGRSVAYSYSIDGETWQDPVDMDPFWSTGSIQSDPWMVFFNHTLYYSYLESDGEQGQITFTFTSDHGSTWTKIRGTYGEGIYADKETFAISENGTIYLVYSDVYTNGDTYTWVKLSRSYDGGYNFVENVTISDQEGIDIGAYILPSISGNLHVLWTHYLWGDTPAPDPDGSSIIYDKSADDGNTFTVDTDFIPEYNATWSERNPENGRSAKHTLAVMEQDKSTGRIYACWADISANATNPNYGWDVYFRFSNDDGLTWSSVQRANKELAGDQWNPDMELDSQGNLHFIYYDEVEQRHLKHRIYYPDNKTFSSESQVSNKPSSPEFTRPGEYNSIRIDSNDTPHIVWTDTRTGALDIYYSKGTTDPIVTATTEFEFFIVIFGLVVFLVFRMKKSQQF